jgi:hypothetical protein
MDALVSQAGLGNLVMKMLTSVQLTKIYVEQLKYVEILRDLTAVTVEKDFERTEPIASVLLLTLLMK